MGKLLSVLCIVAMMFIASVQAKAAIVDGEGYFHDDNTGNTWMDVDTFLGMSCENIKNALSGTGFHIATQEELTQLQASTNPSQFSALRALMNTNPFRTVFGGAYDTGTEGICGRSYLCISHPRWLQAAGGHPSTITHPVLGAWVVSNQGGTSAAVPIPGAVWLLVSGLLGLFGLHRKVTG